MSGAMLTIPGELLPQSLILVDTLAIGIKEICPITCTTVAPLINLIEETWDAYCQF
jgi:hypothetical protein